ncbi:MAG: hypothetical protein HYT70_01440 [Candidatus Aenigmarchaeota archaeon]|nr:hypothetical protein [Candidatus Aenigmarchaeota archaeon]
MNSTFTPIEEIEEAANQPLPATTNHPAKHPVRNYEAHSQRLEHIMNRLAEIPGDAWRSHPLRGFADYREHSQMLDFVTGHRIYSYFTVRLPQIGMVYSVTTIGNRHSGLNYASGTLVADLWDADRCFVNPNTSVSERRLRFLEKLPSYVMNKMAHTPML